MGEFVHVIKGIVCHIDEMLLVLSCRVSVGCRLYAQFLGCGQLQVVHVGKGLVIITYTEYAVLDGFALRIGQDKGLSWFGKYTVDVQAVFDDGVGNRRMLRCVDIVFAGRTFALQE